MEARQPSGSKPVLTTRLIKTLDEEGLPGTLDTRGCILTWEYDSSKCQEKLQQPAVEVGWHLKIHAARDVRGLLQELGLDVGTDASVDGDADLLGAEDAVHGGNVLLPNARASCEH